MLVIWQLLIYWIEILCPKRNSNLNIVCFATINILLLFLIEYFAWILISWNRIYFSLKVVHLGLIWTPFTGIDFLKCVPSFQIVIFPYCSRNYIWSIWKYLITWTENLFLYHQYWTMIVWKWNYTRIQAWLFSYTCII